MLWGISQGVVYRQDLQDEGQFGLLQGEANPASLPEAQVVIYGRRTKLRDEAGSVLERMKEGGDRAHVRRRETDLLTGGRPHEAQEYERKRNHDGHSNDKPYEASERSSTVFLLYLRNFSTLHHLGFD